MIHEIVFSCAGTTRKITDKIARGLGDETTIHDLLDKDFNDTVIDDNNDIIVFAVPVWGGRVPAMAADKLRQIKGNGHIMLPVHCGVQQ